MKIQGVLIGSILTAIVLGVSFLMYTYTFRIVSGPAATTTPGAITSSVEERAHAVLLALKSKDGKALSVLVHPTKGVRFSPYGYISTSTDIVILAGGLADIYGQAKKETWGLYDGSGYPIILSFMEYSNKFLYDVDFLTAPQKATNSVLGHGNSLINITEVYPGATFVEYYFPGFDPQYEGMDWRSIRLIFERMDDGWYLVGISHDQWTI